MDERPNLEAWLRELVEEVPVQMASIMLLVPEEDQLEIFASFGFREAPDLILPIGTGIAGQAVESGEARFVNDVSADPHFVESEYDTRQLLVVPLKQEGKTVGAVNLSNPADKREFDESDQQKVERFIHENPIDFEFYISAQ